MSGRWFAPSGSLLSSWFGGLVLRGGDEGLGAEESLSSSGERKRFDSGTSVVRTSFDCIIMHYMLVAIKNICKAVN